MSDTALWLVVLGGALGCYALKLAGLTVPPQWLEHRLLRRLLDLLPAALLAALVVTQAFTADRAFVLDSRAAGLLAAAVALLLRAPFPVVLIVAGGAAAGVHLLTH